MAKYIIEYNIRIGDRVRFTKSNGEWQVGTVQDISQLPDVFVEGFEDLEYKRWKLGIDKLNVLFDSERDYQGVFTHTEIEIGEDEAVEFVHGDNFEDILVRRLGETEFKKQ